MREVRTTPIGMALALGLTIVLAPSAAGLVSGSETVETPVGTYHVSYDADRGSFEYVRPEFCVPTTTICLGRQYPMPDEPPSAALAVHEETNGCEGLQTDAGDCDGDDEPEDADDEVAALAVP